MFGRGKEGILAATKQDYVDIQGGYPDVYRRGRIHIVHHNYPDGEGMEVCSHKKPSSYGTVILETRDGQLKVFKAALLRQFHGIPCETDSFKRGGSGYRRR